MLSATSGVDRGTVPLFLSKIILFQECKWEIIIINEPIGQLQTCERGRDGLAASRWSSDFIQHTDTILRWDVIVSTALISSQSLLAVQLAKICECVLIKHRMWTLYMSWHQLWMFYPLWGGSMLPSAVLIHPTDVRLDWDLGSFEAEYDHLGPLSCSSNGFCDLVG